jgi:formate dehydrogenase gamma subunit
MPKRAPGVLRFAGVLARIENCRFGLLALALMGLVMACASLREAAAQEMTNKQCLDCHSDKELTKTNQAGKEISLFVDEAKLAASSHAKTSCAQCHADLKSTHPDDEVAAKPVDCARCHDKPSQSYTASVHGLALKAGRSGAATCTDCHGSHEVLPPTSPSSPLHYSKLAATCGECHSEAAADVQASIHGQAAAKGIREAPTCTDCHSEHKIEGLKGTSGKVAQHMCSKCHASERINTKFRLPADRVQTFFETYHGLAVQFGSATAANCASCHGFHKVLPSSDTNSTIHPTHLVHTCGRCHPGATEKFALAKVHVNAEEGLEFGTVVNRYVRRAYVGLIVMVIGLMVVHNGLAWGKKVRAAYRSKSRTVQRMSRAQRLQHLGLLVSFILLALTGFALKYPDSWLAWCLGADENIRRWTHRIAGVVLLVLGGIHLVYIIVTNEGRQLVKDFFPNKKDVTDAVANAAYLLGRKPNKPKFGRFGYVEKAEYWAVVWGTIIMGVTGLMIWLKIDMTQFMPRWVVDVAITIHYYEAILACLAIIVWHFYHVMLDPDIYPMSWAWFDGKVEKHWHEDEHPLDTAARGQAPNGSAEELVIAGAAPNRAGSNGGSEHRPGAGRKGNGAP